MLCFEMNVDVCGKSFHKYLGVISAGITSGEVEGELEVEVEAGHWVQL